MGYDYGGLANNVLTAFSSDRATALLTKLRTTADDLRRFAPPGPDGNFVLAGPWPDDAAAGAHFVGVVHNDVAPAMRAVLELIGEPANWHLAPASHRAPFVATAAFSELHELDGALVKMTGVISDGVHSVAGNQRSMRGDGIGFQANDAARSIDAFVGGVERVRGSGSGVIREAHELASSPAHLVDRLVSSKINEVRYRHLANSLGGSYSPMKASDAAQQAAELAGA